MSLVKNPGCVCVGGGGMVGKQIWMSKFLAKELAKSSERHFLKLRGVGLKVSFRAEVALHSIPLPSPTHVCLQLRIILIQVATPFATNLFKIYFFKLLKKIEYT